jgi:mycothiol synthase
MAITSRPCRPSDLASLRAFTTALWKRRGPHVGCHLGDLAWGMSRLPEEKIHLWLDGGDLVGFTHFAAPGTLDLMLDPDRPDVLRAALAWLPGAAAEPHGDVAPAQTMGVWALESDRATIAVLEEHGLERRDAWYVYWSRPLEPPLPEPALPAGFTLRHFEEVELAQRVAVHQAAFAPSRLTIERYTKAMNNPPYRRDLDVVAVAPDGSFAAFCIGWLDPTIGVGELEPVGTHPAYQRLGLGRAVCFEIFARLARLGARTAIVYSWHATPASAALYASVGFRPVDRSYLYEAALPP